MPDTAPKMPSWLRAVVFDLDGTLVDSAPDIATAVTRALSDRAIVINAAEARRYLGDGARRLMARVLAAHIGQVDDTTLDTLTARFNACYREMPCQDSVMFAGVETALSRLADAGVGLAICTNKPQPIAEQVVAHLGLDRFIDCVIGAGVYPLKPDPAPVLACVSALGSNTADTLYIGDMAVDRDAARAAGLPVVLAAFGYSATPVAEWHADGVLSHWDELESTLEHIARPA